MGLIGWTAQDVTRHNLKIDCASRPSKYRSIKKTVNGITFDSTKEANRYLELLLLFKAGEIGEPAVQPQFELIACNGEIIGVYTADFRYLDKRSGREVVEDVKSTATKTEAYRLRKRLAQACHGITITEV